MWDILPRTEKRHQHVSGRHVAAYPVSHVRSSQFGRLPNGRITLDINHAHSTQHERCRRHTLRKVAVVRRAVEELVHVERLLYVHGRHLRMHLLRSIGGKEDKNRTKDKIGTVAGRGSSIFLCWSALISRTLAWCCRPTCTSRNAIQCERTSHKPTSHTLSSQLHESAPCGTRPHQRGWAHSSLTSPPSSLSARHLPWHVPTPYRAPHPRVSCILTVKHGSPYRRLVFVSPVHMLVRRRFPHPFAMFRVAVDHIGLTSPRMADSSVHISLHKICFLFKQWNLRMSRHCSLGHSDRDDFAAVDFGNSESVSRTVFWKAIF